MNTNCLYRALSYHRTSSLLNTVCVTITEVEALAAKAKVQDTLSFVIHALSLTLPPHKAKFGIQPVQHVSSVVWLLLWAHLHHDKVGAEL